MKIKLLISQNNIEFSRTLKKKDIVIDVNQAENNMKAFTTSSWNATVKRRAAILTAAGGEIICKEGNRFKWAK